MQNNTNQTRNSAKTNDQTGSNTTKPHYEHLMRKTGHMDRFLASIRASR